METQSISSFHFPPGVRFHPSDEELIVFYLRNKVKSLPVPAAIIADIELYSYNPWDLPKKALFGDEEWYFFTPRDRKYPNGARPNRTAATGYWKATGTDKPIINSSGARIGVKKALVFYIGKPPSGTKTDWLMIEYRMPDSPDRPLRSKGSMRLDDWVLCRIKQKGNMSKNSWELPQCPNKDLGEVTYVKEELPNPNISGQCTQNNPNPSELCSNYFLSKDCHLLAKLLATDHHHHHHDFPSVESDNNAATSQSSIISGNNYNNDATAYNEHPMNNPIFGNAFNQHGKRQSENEYDSSSASPPKKATVNFTGTVTTMNGGSMFYNQQHLSNEDTSKLNLQELDVYAFAQRFLQ